MYTRKKFFFDLCGDGDVMVDIISIPRGSQPTCVSGIESGSYT